MIDALMTLLVLILGLAFIAFVIVGFPALLYMLYLWLRLQRELTEPKPFSFADANLIWNPGPDRYTLKGRVMVPIFLKWQRIGIACLFGAAIAGPLATWLSRSSA